ALSYYTVLCRAHGSVVFNADGSFTYSPDANYNGPDSFTFKANDGTADSNTATVTVTVSPVNDAPVAADLAITSAEDATASGQAAASDVDGDALTFSLVAGPAHGSLAFNADGTFTYTPNGNYNGSDSFTFKANDGTTDSNVSTVSIMVTPVNDAPVAADQSATAAEDSVLGGQVAASDVDGDVLTYSLV